jgi:flagella basal body P-ring formation protein FlgA
LVVPDRPVVLALESSHTGTWRGRVILRVDARENEPGTGMKTEASSTLSYLVRVSCPQMTALRLIPRGAVVGPDDAALRLQDVTYQQEDGFGDTASCYGLNARKPVPEGSILTAAMLELPLAVRRGDMVRLVVRAGRIKVEALAEALRDGRKGESIPVEVGDTKKKINATVLGPGLCQAVKP